MHRVGSKAHDNHGETIFMRRSQGFTLIELMIVVAIIAVIAAVAVPSMLRSRIQTNEAAAVASLRTVCQAELGFHSAKNRFADLTTLATEPPGNGISFLDNTWAGGVGGVVERQGYVFFMPPPDAADFLCYADPKTPGGTGTKWFRVDASSVIRWNSAARPADTDPTIDTPR